MIEAHRIPKSPYHSQSKYICVLLRQIKTDGAKPISSLISSGSKLFIFDGEPLPYPTEYWSDVGDLQYILVTRPDIAFAVDQICKFMDSPSTLQSNGFYDFLKELCISGCISHKGAHFYRPLQILTELAIQMIRDLPLAMGCFWAHNYSHGMQKTKQYIVAWFITESE